MILDLKKNQTIRIDLKHLPKVSLNKIYESKHWSYRQKLKREFLFLVKSQYKSVLSKDGVYVCDYVFCFATHPLDASNCFFAIKMIEDVIFEDDNYKVVREVSARSVKGKENVVSINITRVL